MDSKIFRSPAAWHELLHRRDLLRVGAVGIAIALLPEGSSIPGVL
jgi:hypothetical protein